MDNRYRFVVVFITVLNALLIIFLCGLLRDVRADVNSLRNELVSKQDLINVATPHMTFFYEQKCTTCHSERRFAGEHNVRGDIERAVAHMAAMPDANFSEEDIAKIHGSLALLRCTQCHGADKLRTLAIKSPEQRAQIIREMIAKPGSRIGPDEARMIERAYDAVLLGR